MDANDQADLETQAAADQAKADAETAAEADGEKTQLDSEGAAKADEVVAAADDGTTEQVASASNGIPADDVAIVDDVFGDVRLTTEPVHARGLIRHTKYTPEERIRLGLGLPASSEPAAPGTLADLVAQVRDMSATWEEFAKAFDRFATEEADEERKFKLERFARGFEGMAASLADELEGL